MQFGVFCPVMRIHGTRNRVKDQAPPAPEYLQRPEDTMSYGALEKKCMRVLVKACRAQRKA